MSNMIDRMNEEADEFWSIVESGFHSFLRLFHILFLAVYLRPQKDFVLATSNGAAFSYTKTSSRRS